MWIFFNLILVIPKMLNRILYLKVRLNVIVYLDEICCRVQKLYLVLIMVNLRWKLNAVIF